jgi:hypothetical protein
LPGHAPKCFDPTNSWAIRTALKAVPLRRLWPLTQKVSLRPSRTGGSVRIRPTRQSLPPGQGLIRSWAPISPAVALIRSTGVLVTRCSCVRDRPGQGGRSSGRQRIYLSAAPSRSVAKCRSGSGPPVGASRISRLSTRRSALVRTRRHQLRSPGAQGGHNVAFWRHFHGGRLDFGP